MFEPTWRGRPLRIFKRTVMQKLVELGMDLSHGAPRKERDEDSEKTFRIEGFEVRGWRCPKCGEDAEIYLLHKKLQKEPAKAKVGVLGKSMVLRIKKEIAEALGLKKGTEKT